MKLIRFVKKLTRKINRERIGKLFYFIRHEGIGSTVKRFRLCVESDNNIKRKKIDIVPFEEIIDLKQCERLEFKKEEQPLVSVIIPVYNQFTYTYNCLKSILENTGDISYEVIIADDNSQDLTIEIEKVAGNVKVVKNSKNLLFLRNCNHAAEFASGKYLFFLNNDTQVQENWLQPLVDLMAQDESIGLTGSKLIYSDGTLQEAGGIIWKNAGGWNYGNGDDSAMPQYNYVKEVDYISGAAIMIRKELWDEIGGFDEYFAPAYCEDSDLAFEVRKRGYKVVYQPLSVVVHFEGKSNGTDVTKGIKSYQLENSRKFAVKWKFELRSQYENGRDVFEARERGRGKKCILFIDHYVPQFDKDAGSRTTFQYLKMLVGKGYRVKFMGDNFYQHEPYTTVLQQMGIEVLYGPWHAKNALKWIKDNQEYIDIAYVNRPHITIKYIDFLEKETNIKIIYYGHDLHFLRTEREYELSGDQKKKKEAEEWKEQELYIMRKASMNYYPSSVEADAIHAIDPKIPVKAITAYVFESFRDLFRYQAAGREGFLFVGGFGHGPNIDAVLWFAKEVYPRIYDRLKVPFYVVGSNAPDSITGLKQPGVVIKGFVSDEELEELYRTSRMVVVPLRYGAGVKGKVVEAMYYGAPIVTTSVGVEGIPDVGDFIAVEDTEEAFADRVVKLYEAQEELARMSEGCQRYVRENFCIDAVWDIIKQDF